MVDDIDFLSSLLDDAHEGASRTGNVDSLFSDIPIPRSGSELSVSSDTSVATVATLATVTPTSLIKAFCTFNGYFLYMQYPSDSNGWSYRADIGGNSQHRWEWGDAITLMVRHSTCARAVIARKICRNCEMKAIWRKECSDPCNTFYVLASKTVPLCIAALQRLVMKSHAATPNEYQLYMAHCPKASTSRKRSLADPEEKMKRMLWLEQKMRVAVTGDSPDVDDRPLLEQLVASHELEHALEASVGGTFSAAPNTALAPSTLSSELLRDTSLALQAVGVSNSQDASGYDMLLSKLQTAVKTNLRVLLSTSTLNQIGKFSTLKTAMVQKNSMLDGLVVLLQLGHPAHLKLLMKPMIVSWTSNAKLAAVDDSTLVHLGFYAPTSPVVFKELCTNGHLPPFLVEANHRVESDVFKLNLHMNLPPLLVAYFKPKGRMVPGNHILPLSIIDDHGRDGETKNKRACRK